MINFRQAVPKYRKFFDVWKRIYTLYDYQKYINDRISYEVNPTEVEDMVLMVTYSFNNEQLLSIYEDMLVEGGQYTVFGYVLEHHLQEHNELSGILRGIISSVVLYKAAELEDEDETEDETEGELDIGKVAAVSTIEDLLEISKTSEEHPIDIVLELNDQEIINIVNGLAARGSLTFDGSTAAELYENGEVGGMYGAAISFIYAVLEEEDMATPETYESTEENTFEMVAMRGTK